MNTPVHQIVTHLALRDFSLSCSPLPAQTRALQSEKVFKLNMLVNMGTKVMLKCTLDLSNDDDDDGDVYEDANIVKNI